jgi:hypothetical protein
MRKLQELFDVVLDSGLYNNDESYVLNHIATPFMCNAVSNARRAGLITMDEMVRVKESISNYIHKLTNTAHDRNNVLCMVLLHCGLLPDVVANDSNFSEKSPVVFAYMVKLYGNWANRPYKRKAK